MDSFEREVRGKLKNYISTDKIYLKKNYYSEMIVKHKVSEEMIDYIFYPQKIIGISQNIASEERVDILVQAEKNKRLKVIIQFDPVINEQKYAGKIGIITAFFI